jgi:hypothetical protein
MNYRFFPLVEFNLMFKFVFKIGAKSVNASIVDLAHDAELLETCTKRNDKYTVRRILDVHYSYFRIKQQQPTSTGQTTDEQLIRKQSSVDTAAHNSIGGGESLIKSTMAAANSSTSRSCGGGKKCVPSIFLNILHLAVENNSLDVLRICLKYGLNPDEPGTTLRKLYLDKNMFTNYEEDLSGRCHRKSVRYPVKCGFCKFRAAKEKAAKAAAVTIKQTTTVTTTTTTTATATATCLNANVKQTQTLLYEFEMQEQQQQQNQRKANSGHSGTATARTTIVIDDFDSHIELSPQITALDQIDYSSFLYLIRLPPLFLSVSKCNHAATELLLTYGACPNVQDDLGNIFVFQYKELANFRGL